MEKYAIFKNGSKQYRVAEGEELLVDRLGQSDGKVVFDEVILVGGEGKTNLGTPFVKGAKVEALVLGEEKGKKIRVSKFKAKSRYRKTIGHRTLFSRVKVEKIVL